MATVSGSPNLAVQLSLRAARQAMIDSLAWPVSLVLAAWARYDFDLTRHQFLTVLTAGAGAVVLQNAIGHALYLYRGRYSYGGFEEVRAVSTTVLTTTMVLLGLDLLWPDRPLPASTPVIGGVLALVGMLGVRYVGRLQRERPRRPNPTAEPVLVIGAGEAGTRLIRSMLRDPASKYLPVGLVDDDPTKRNLRAHGVPVLGSRADLAALITRTGIPTVVLAIPSAPPGLIRQVRSQVEETGAGLKVLPSVSNLLDHRVTVSDIRDVNVTDLLGRGQVRTDLTSIAKYLTGQRVLVTGAGGSIGSELCRQIHRYGPSELIMLDRDESALHAVQLSVYGRAMLDDHDVVLADLRDERRIQAIFAERRPQVVFHAAALKHQPLLEQYPAEAVKSNILGTVTVLEAAAAHGVDVLVNISTDKAADPCSVLGYSKRVGERLTAAFAERVPGRFLSVRFGNVLGSRGSVLTAFAAQIATGGPITVTDPRVTRYFMTVQEAVQLVIQAGAVGQPGEALVLDMGEPVRIAEVARQMASMAAEPVDIVYTGLRPGEKLHESLLGVGESDQRPCHPLISHVDVPPLAPGLTRVLDLSGDREAIVEQLAQLCATAVAPSFVAVGAIR